MVYQFYNLLPVLTVDENIMLPHLLDGAIRRIRGGWIRWWRRWGWRTGETTFRASSPAASSSESPLAGLFSTHPAIVLADEPTGKS